MESVQKLIVPLLFPPINSSASEIRLLILLPSQCETAPTRCEHVVVSLLDKPLYETLSYAWGDATSQSSQKSIFIDEKLTAVTPNLYQALQRTRLVDQPRRLWIDAICINQADDVEKTQQVNMMRRIYRQCTMCVIWLGSLEDSGVTISEAQDALDSVKWMAGADSSRKSESDANSNRGTGSEILARMDRPAWFDDDDEARCATAAKAFKVMMKRPWWERIWTLQEALLPPTSTLCWGSCELSWDIIDLASESIMNKLDNIPRDFYDNDSVDDLTAVMRGMRATMEEESDLSRLWRWRYRKSTDPRDKVYGLMGILRGKDPERDDEEGALLAGLTSSDYTIDAHALFCRVTVNLIRQNGNLLPLIGRRGERPRVEGLPSWVVDWTRAEPTASEESYSGSNFWCHRELWMLSDYTADRGIHGVGDGVKTLDEDQILCLDGVCVDRIAMVEARKEGELVWPTNKYPSIEALLFGSPRWGELIARCQALFQSSPVLQELWAQGTWMRDLLGLLVGTLDPDRVICYQDFWIREILRYHVVFVTEKGRFGLGPVSLAVGHEVWVVGGCIFPVVLRPLESQFSPSSGRDGGRCLDFEWGGECLVHGIMQGEAVEGREDEQVEIRLH